MAPDAPWTLDRAWIKPNDIGQVVHGDGCAQDRLECTGKPPISMGIFRTVPGTPGISTQELSRVRQPEAERRSGQRKPLVVPLCRGAPADGPRVAAVLQDYPA